VSARKLLAITGLLILSSFGASAQGRRGGMSPGPGGAAGPGGQMPAIIERLERMTPEQRQAFLDSLPPGRRARVEQRLREWEQLTPEQRARLVREFRRFRDLTPAQQQLARQCFVRLRAVPMPRRRMLGRQIMLLRAMTPEERRAWLDGAYFKDHFNPDEQEIIKGLMDVGPEPPAVMPGAPGPPPGR